MTQPSLPLVVEISEPLLSGPALLALTQAVLERQARCRFRATGGSMWPTLRDGDLLTLAPLGDAAVGPGDVVAFVQPASGKLVVHRIVAADGGQYLVQGDRLSTADGWVPREALLGRVVAAERNGRRVRLGSKIERRGIAWLNRHGLLQPALTWSVRAASFCLRRLQRLALYRRLARRYLPPPVVRPATAEDRRRAYAQFNLADPCAPLPPQMRVTDFVALVGAEIAGFVQLVQRPLEQMPYGGWWLFSLIVRTRYRGAGIGEALTRAVMAQARADGARELRLLVHADNLPAIRLYRKLGFNQIVTPELTAHLAEEAKKTGRQRIVMTVDLSSRELWRDVDL